MTDTKISALTGVTAAGTDEIPIRRGGANNKVTAASISALATANGASAVGHTHDDRYYTEAEADALLTGKAASVHTHDDRYFTEAEITTLLTGKADTVHNHDSLYYTKAQSDTLLTGKSDTSHTHDTRYYTETETDTLLSGKAASSHTHDDRYFTEAETTTLLNGKADSVHNHDSAYYTKAQSDSSLGGKANTSHTHGAADIASGTVATARLGSGTASGTTYLRGDQTWADPTADTATLRSTSPTITVTPNGSYIDIADARTNLPIVHPGRNGLLGWTMPFVWGTSAQALTSGVIYLFKQWAEVDMTISRLWMNVDAAQVGGTASQNYIGLYDASGTRLQMSADLTTAFSSTGNKQMDLTSSQSFTKGTAFYIALVTNAATTQLGVRRASLITPANIGLSNGANVLIGSLAAPNTTLPNTITPGNITIGGGQVFPIGYS